jgi:hypothetical protein
MELHSIVFPSPEFSHDIEDHKEELIFIPKIKSYEDEKEEVLGYIPCLILESKKKNLISKNFMVYFHGNAEDIFYAREIAERIRHNLAVSSILNFYHITNR